MIDWYPITHLPVFKETSELIRRHFGVRTGIFTAQGIVALSGELQAVANPLCEAFMSRGVPCALNYRTWFEEISHAKTGVFLTCHAGLRGIAVPVFSEETCVAAVFASGWLSSAQQNSQAIFERSRALGLDTITLSSGMERHHPLTERESSLLLDLLSMLARIAEKMIAETPSQAEMETFSGWYGTSPLAEDTRHALALASRSAHPVLLCGAEGTGKTLAATLIHTNSARRDMPFLVLSCESPIETHFDSELFGHKRGAFPGAICDFSGLLDMGHGGTLLLEDIDRLTPALQKRVLRLIESSEYAPTGDNVMRSIDIRIIATTRLSMEAIKGVLDRALYDALTCHAISLPSLNRHPEDIPVLAAHILAELECTLVLSPAVFSALQLYSWPGNVRELKTELERLTVLCRDHDAEETDLSERIYQNAQTLKSAENAAENQLKTFRDLPSWLDDVERNMIIHILEQNHYNRTRSAEILGISRRNLIRKIERFGIETPTEDE